MTSLAQPHWLEAHLQRRRLAIAALAVLTELPAALRAGWVLDLSLLPEREALQRARLLLAGAGAGTSSLSRASEPARFTDMCSAAERLAAAWFTAGVRLTAVHELCDERDCLLPLADPTPAVLWAGGSALQDDDAFWQKRRITVINSRQPRQLLSTTAWLVATRDAVRQLVSAETVYIGGVSELPAQVARTAALLQNAALLDVLVEPLPEACAAWLKFRGRPPRGSKNASADEPKEEPLTPAALRLSAVWPEEAVRSTGDARQTRSLRRDDLVLAITNEAVAVSIRAGGNWAARLNAITQKASAGRTPARLWAVSPTAAGLRERGAQILIERGCRILEPKGAVVVENAAIPDPPAGQAKLPTQAPHMLTADSFDEATWPYLTHWTRRPEGAWPDESFEAHLREVLEGGLPHSATAADTLARIVRMRKVLGARLFLRHGPAVCFTQWTPRKLLSMNRRHRGLNRLLYEPFGIGLRREFLEARGARAAIYGDEATWQDLAERERFRFQYEGDPSDPWSREAEWRMTGDLDLRDIPPQEIVLLVPDESAAHALHAHLAPDFNTYIVVGSEFI